MVAALPEVESKDIVGSPDPPDLIFILASPDAL